MVNSFGDGLNNKVKTSVLNIETKKYNNNNKKNNIFFSAKLGSNEFICNRDTFPPLSH